MCSIETARVGPGMAGSPSTSSTPAVPPIRYQYLESLSDIKSIRDLNQDAVRDILRNHTSDHGLEVVNMGEITDMSGLNDAFNSTICSLKIKARFSGKGRRSRTANQADASTAADGEGDSGAELDEEAAASSAGNDLNMVGRAGEEKEYNFVIKSPPKMSFIRMVHKLSRPFFNEVSWYLDLAPQQEQVLGGGDRSLGAILPTCFHAYSTYYADEHCGGGSCCTRGCPWWCWITCKRAESGVLILENVKLRPGRSYKMFDKRVPLPLPHVQLIFRELAHFHGKWLKWIHRIRAGKGAASAASAAEGSAGSASPPMSFKTFQSTYNTQRRIPSFLYKQLKNVARKTVVKILNKKGEGQEENIRRVKHFFDNVAMQKLSEYMSREPSPVYTLCHGDFWSNNILFSYAEDDDGGAETAQQEKDYSKLTPRDLILIDFQLINYGHPAYDLVYFTYLNTDKQFRDQHLQSVLIDYHDVLSGYISEINAERAEGAAELKYDFQSFLTDFDEHRPLGFTTACSVMPNVLSDCQVDLDANGLLALRELQRKQEQELDDDDNPSSVEIRRRIVDMVDEMARDNMI